MKFWIPQEEARRLRECLRHIVDTDEEALRHTLPAGARVEKAISLNAYEIEVPDSWWMRGGL